MGIDLIGSGEKVVAVIELEEKSQRKIKKIAEGILKKNKNVKTVIQRFPLVRGKFRMKRQKFVLGNRNTEVFHREYGYVLKLDPMEVYFSPRESGVRQYVAEQVKPKEEILLMFAGIGPYAICIAKKQPRVKEIVAIELNPKAVEYMKENIRINKVSHLVTPIKGEVEIICKKLTRKFDRIIMPMIKAKDFLELAVKIVKKNGMIHIYLVSVEGEPFNDCKKIVDKIFRKMKKRYEIKDIRKISLYAPEKWKVLMEIKVK